MKYLIVEPRVKAIAPNIALMKWCRWCEDNGHEYQYVRGEVEPDIIPDKILMSLIFTYYSKRYEKTIDYYLDRFFNSDIVVGGVFPTLYPKWFEKSKWGYQPFFNTSHKIEVHQGMSMDIEDLAPKYNVDIKSEDNDPYDRNKIVLYASRGCTNKCAYCAVPRLEGSMKSFKSIKYMLNSAREDLPEARSVVLYDNNFTEHEYFDNIVDELVEFNLPVDIHGLHVDAFTRHHAERLSELNWQAQSETGTAYIRFSFDKVQYANNLERALTMVRDTNIKAAFFAYMLFNFTDKPEDFWWRIQKAQEIVDRVGKTIFLFPQRYEPFKSLKRNSYIGKHWTSDLVRGLVKLYTFYGHGFIPITKSRNIFKWIGSDLDDFIKRSLSMMSKAGFKSPAFYLKV
jgi:hypothetical protein